MAFTPSPPWQDFLIRKLHIAARTTASVSLKTIPITTIAFTGGN
jgi:hypothetical protein